MIFKKQKMQLHTQCLSCAPMALWVHQHPWQQEPFAVSLLALLLSAIILVQL